MTDCCNQYQIFIISFICINVIIIIGFVGYQYYKQRKQARLRGTLNNFANSNSPPRNSYQSFESP